MNPVRLVTFSVVLFCSLSALAQTEVEKEPIGVVEVGAVQNWSVNGSGSSISPTAGFEFTAIPRWLELEIGVTPTFAHHTTEWDTGLLFKKPWTLTRRLEVMAGTGPSWIHAREDSVTRNSIGAEAILDFMYWPTASRRFGWYFEPGYEYNFGKGREQSLGFSFGLLIAIQR